MTKKVTFVRATPGAIARVDFNNALDQLDDSIALRSARVHNPTPTTLANGVAEVMTWSSELHDDGNIFDLLGDKTVFKIPETGLYYVAGQVGVNDPIADTIVDIQLAPVTGSPYKLKIRPHINGLGTQDHSVEMIRKFIKNELVRMTVRQTSGAGLTIQTGLFHTSFEIAMLQ